MRLAGWLCIMQIDSESDTAKLVLRLAGITDIWTVTKGNTKSRTNMAKAVFNALENMYKVMTVKEWGA